MPELPEVETITRELNARVRNRIIAAIHVFWSRTLQNPTDEFVRLLAGKKIIRVSRRGKYIFVHCSDSILFSIHLRMTGKIVFRLTENEKKHLRIEIDFSDGSALYFIDPRKFGKMKLWPSGQPILAELGPEPLEPSTVLQVLRQLKTARPIKTVLLDQKILAGLGNIYADEALFLSGIHPLTPASLLKKIEQKKLSLAIPEILKQAIDRKGTTLRDYRTTRNSSGENQDHLSVYGRFGRPCPECRNPIRKTRIAGRSSHFCPVCQRKRDGTGT
jgi:formamidopyrimidine-DNA glycosylase